MCVPFVNWQPHLPVELLSEVLTAARSIEDSFSRAEALGELAPRLPAEQRAEVLAEALTAARSIEDKLWPCACPS